MQHKRLSVLMATLGVLAVAAAVAPAIGEPHRPAVIVGQILDADNHPVVGARVALMAGPGDVVRTMESNAQGRYEFRPVRPGRYAVGAAKPDVGAGRTPVFAAKPGEITRAPVHID